MADDRAHVLPLPRRDLDADEEKVLALGKGLIKRLTDDGHVALIAGGWVRDALLGRRSLDIDVATSAPPPAVASLFDRVVPMPNDTLIVVVDGVPFEVTPFRTAGGGGRDGGGGDGARDDTSPLAAAAADAAARDFTVNALFYDPARDAVLDYVGGAADCAARTLRGCGDPAARLAEDPLRVLRAVRFAAGLGLTLDDDTARAVAAAAGECAPPGVAAERIWKELVKLAAAEGERPGAFADGVRLARDLGVLAVVLPEAGGPDTDAALRRCGAAVPPALRVAVALPPDRMTGEALAALAARLKLSRREARALEALAAVRQLDGRGAGGAPPAPSPMDWVALYATDAADGAVAAANALIEGEGERAAHAAAHAARRARWAAGVDRARQGRLLLTAKDALAAGAPKGKALGDLLRRGEAVAVEEGLGDGAAVVARLRELGEWPSG